MDVARPYKAICPTLDGEVLMVLAGTIGQSAGVWTLVPYTLALAALQFVVWRPLALWIRRSTAQVSRAPAS